MGVVHVHPSIWGSSFSKRQAEAPIQLHKGPCPILRQNCAGQGSLHFTHTEL